MPGPTVPDPEELRQFVRNEAWGHHASGTCKIGRREDRDGRWWTARSACTARRGCASWTRRSSRAFPGLFIVSAVYMVAEKASDVILSDGARAPGEDRMSRNEVRTKTRDGVLVDHGAAEPGRSTGDRRRGGRILWIARCRGGRAGIAVSLPAVQRWTGRSIIVPRSTTSSTARSAASLAGRCARRSAACCRRTRSSGCCRRSAPTSCRAATPSLGFIYEPGHELPIGVSRRYRLGFDQVGLNCAVCHTGTLRDSPRGDRATSWPACRRTSWTCRASSDSSSTASLDERFTPDNVLGRIAGGGREIWAGSTALLYRIRGDPAHARADAAAVAAAGAS